MIAVMVSALTDCAAALGMATGMRCTAGADRAAGAVTVATGHTCGAVSAGGTGALTTYSGATAMASTLNRGACAVRIMTATSGLGISGRACSQQDEQK